MVEEGHDHAEEGHEEHDHGDEPFPLPYLLLITGYTLMLFIDKVLFNAHATFDHGHDHGHGVIHKEKESTDNHDDIEERKPLRRSSVSAAHHAAVKQVQEDIKQGVDLEEALERSMSTSMKRSEMFAARISIAKKKKTHSN